MTIQTILKACENFSKSQNIKILKLLISMNVLIVECADGCRINLDRLTPEQIVLLELEIEKIDCPVEQIFLIE